MASTRAQSKSRTAAKTKKASGRARVVPVNQVARKFGIRLTPGLIVSLSPLFAAKSDPSGLARLLREGPALFDYAIPNEEILRDRLVRSLAGVELIVRAGRIVLSSPEFNIVTELKGAVRAASLKARNLGTTPSKDEIKLVGREFERMYSGMVKRLRATPDPVLQNAYYVLSHFAEVLDPTRPLPRVYLPETVGVETLLVHDRLRPHRRRQA